MEAVAATGEEGLGLGGAKMTKALLMRNTASRAGVVVLWGIVIGILVYSPLMATLEGELLPVTSGIVPGPGVARDGGLDFSFSYTKYRACRLLGVSARKGDLWTPFYIVPGQPSEGGGTRAPGPQRSLLWHLGEPSLEGVQISFVHDCHLGWVTITKVFDGGAGASSN